MRIALVTDFYYPWIGGPASLLRNLGHGLAARGHSVHLLAPSPSGAPGNERDGEIEIRRASTIPSPFGYDLRVARHPLREAGGWLDQIRPDVVHVHHPFPLSAAAVFAARRRRIPLVATNHTIPECSLWGIRQWSLPARGAEALLGAWIGFLLRRCDIVTTPTRTAAAALTELGYQAEFNVISNGVDTERFRPGPPNLALRERLGLDERPVVLYTGRLDAEKDMGVWIRAAARAGNGAQYVIGGHGADRARLEDLSRTLGLASSVRFIGYLPDHDFPDLYRLADIYFITSPVELQSISTLEALASGLPVVGVRAGALPELIHHDRNGYLVPPGDSVTAGALLNTLAEAPEIRRIMGSASRAIAETHDLGQSVMHYERLLQRAALRVSGGEGVDRASIVAG